MWILFRDSNGQVESYTKISHQGGGFTGTLGTSDRFGEAIASIRDLDSDGVPDLAVGAPYTGNAGGNRKGAVWILFLRSNGRVKSHVKIDQGEGGFTENLDEDDMFGSAIASVGDLDGDGIADLAVGAPGTSALPREDVGGLYILFQRADGTVKSHRKITWTVSGFQGGLHTDDHFGRAVASGADLDADGVWDLAVGAYGDDDGCDDCGAVWLLYLKTDGTVKGFNKISVSMGKFDGQL